MGLPSAMRVITTELLIEVRNILVEDKYYSFTFEIWVNGKLRQKGEYSDSHSWDHDKKHFEQLLKDYYATQLAIEKISPSILTNNPSVKTTNQ